MFQQTQSRGRQDGNQEQEQISKEQQKQAQERTSETQRRMEQDAARRDFDGKRQSIDGKLRDVHVEERDAVRKQEVVDKTKADISGAVDHELAKLNPPTLLDDGRASIREEILRAAAERAESLAARKEATDKSESVADPKLVERRREDERDLIHAAQMKTE